MSVIGYGQRGGRMRRRSRMSRLKRRMEYEETIVPEKAEGGRRRAPRARGAVGLHEAPAGLDVNVHGWKRTGRRKERRAKRNPAFDGFDGGLFDDAFGVPVEAAPYKPRVMERVKRDDVLVVGATRWLVFRAFGSGSSEAWVYKHGSKARKTYSVFSMSDDEAIVWETNGMNERVREVARGRPSIEAGASRNPGPQGRGASDPLIKAHDRSPAEAAAMIARMSRRECIAWLQWNDPNGVYDDRAYWREFGQRPPTLAYYRRLIAVELEGGDPIELWGSHKDRPEDFATDYPAASEYEGSEDDDGEV